MPVSFSTSAEEARQIHLIARRAVGFVGASLGVRLDLLSLEMDLTACHANGCPLKLAELLHADDANFTHDVLGIRTHLDRHTGRLGDCFLPRFSA
jgi:hypothetical protein